MKKLPNQYPHGHALDNVPHTRLPGKSMQCQPCGNAIARNVCVICYVPLCERHTVRQNGLTFCKAHRQGWQVK
jgi:hypothetical protein